MNTATIRVNKQFINTPMRIAILVTTLILYPILLASPIFSQQTMEIGGYLVDTEGRPVRDGKITIFHGPPFYIGDVTEYWRTFDDGYFGLVIDWKPKLKVWILIEERSEGFYPIGDSDLLTTKFFKGITISKYSKSTEFGNVTSYIRYGKAIVGVSSASDEFINKIKRSVIIAKIIDADKNLISETSFGPALSENGKELVFNLPEGRWNIEFIDTSNGEIIMPAKDVIITKQKPANISLLRIRGSGKVR